VRWTAFICIKPSFYLFHLLLRIAPNQQPLAGNQGTENT